MEPKNCQFFAGKMGIPKTLENGNGIVIRARQPLGLWDLCDWTLGFSQNKAGKCEEGPPFRTLN